MNVLVYVTCCLVLNPIHPFIEASLELSDNGMIHFFNVYKMVIRHGLSSENHFVINLILINDRDIDYEMKL